MGGTCHQALTDAGYQTSTAALSPTQGNRAQERRRHHALRHSRVLRLTQIPVTSGLVDPTTAGRQGSSLQPRSGTTLGAPPTIRTTTPRRRVRRGLDAPRASATTQ